MPISDVFDPYTGGAQGGVVPGGGGAGFAWQQITDLSTLSFSDPNNLVTGYSVAGGLHSLSVDNVPVANADYNFGAAPNFTGARYYFPLTYDNGSPVEAQDAFNWSMKVTDFAVNTTRTYHLAFGVVQNPTSTVLTTMDGLGNTFGMSGVGTPLAGTWRRSTVGTASVPNATRIYGQALFSGLPDKKKVGATTAIQDATQTGFNQGQDGNAWTVSNNSQLYGIILVGTLGTATATAGTIDFKLFYNVGKMS